MALEIARLIPRPERAIARHRRRKGELIVRGPRTPMSGKPPGRFAIQGSSRSIRTSALVRAENSRGAKKLPAARLAASDRVG